MLKVSDRSDISPFIVMDVMRMSAAREAAGEHVLHLEVGQPDTPAPLAVRAAARAAINTDKIGYTVALGLDALRERIARHYKDFYDLDVRAENVVTTSGASGGFVLAVLAAFDPGDRVAIASPGYPCYRNTLTSLGIEPVVVPVSGTDRFQLTPELLDHVGPIDGVVVASPSNPTGTLIEAPKLSALAEWCRSKGVRLVSDEIYHGITFGGHRATTAIEYSPGAIVVNSFSKYFSMTGWRLGWLVAPQDLVRPIERLIQNLYIAAPTLSQLAGVAAFDCYEEMDQHVAHYARNRDILLEGLPAAGISDLAPADGAFYIYANASHLTSDSLEFCRKLLAETNIAITPGVDFDRDRGHQAIRFSYAGATEDVAEAVVRIREWLSRSDRSK